MKRQDRARHRCDFDGRKIERDGEGESERCRREGGAKCRGKAN